MRVRPAKLAQLPLVWIALSSCHDPPHIAAKPAQPAKIGSRAVFGLAPVPTSSTSCPARSSLPEIPAGIDPARFEVLRSICSLASWHGPNGLQVGCRSTPPFDAPNELPDGELREAANASDICALNDFYRGSFSSPGKHEVILGLATCGEDRLNDATPGNVLLVERHADAWRVTAVEPATNLAHCWLSTRIDRTLLVCSDNVGAYGDGSLWWNFTLDFSRPPGKRTHVFSKLFKTGGVSCAHGAEFLVEQGVTDFETVSQHFADSDGDGEEELTLTIERAYAPGSATLTKKFQALCRQHQEGDQLLDARMFLPPKKRFELKFQGEASTLVPTPETQRLLEEWGQTAPQAWWNSR